MRGSDRFTCILRISLYQPEYAGPYDGPSLDRVAGLGLQGLSGLENLEKGKLKDENIKLENLGNDKFANANNKSEKR